jgi:hypothetical protein
MDGLTFTDHLIGHLAWPLAVAGLIGFLSLRHRAAIDSLIHRVHKAKAGLFEIELAQVKAQADRMRLPSPPVSNAPGVPKDRPTFKTGQEEADVLEGLLKMAIEDPRRAVIESYHRVHDYARDQLGQFLDADGPPVHSDPDAVKANASEYASILHNLRLVAILAQDPNEVVTPKRAREYVLLAVRAAAYMKGYHSAEGAIETGKLLGRAKRQVEDPGSTGA